MQKELLKIGLLFALAIFAMSHLGEGKIILMLCELTLLYYLSQIIYESSIKKEFDCAHKHYNVYGATKSAYKWTSYKPINWEELEKDEYNKISNKIQKRDKKNIVIKVLDKK